MRGGVDITGYPKKWRGLWGKKKHSKMDDFGVPLFPETSKCCHIASWKIPAKVTGKNRRFLFLGELSTGHLGTKTCHVHKHHLSGVGIDVPMFHITQLLGIPPSPTDMAVLVMWNQSLKRDINQTSSILHHYLWLHTNVGKTNIHINHSKVPFWRLGFQHIPTYSNHAHGRPCLLSRMKIDAIHFVLQRTPWLPQLQGTEVAPPPGPGRVHGGFHPVMGVPPSILDWEVPKKLKPC